MPLACCAICVMRTMRRPFLVRGEVKSPRIVVGGGLLTPCPSVWLLSFSKRSREANAMTSAAVTKGICLSHLPCSSSWYSSSTSFAEMPFCLSSHTGLSTIVALVKSWVADRPALTTSTKRQSLGDANRREHSCPTKTPVTIPS